MEPRIIRHSGIEEQYTDERCYVKELAGGELDPGLSFALARVRAGVATALHALKGTSERYIIIQGRGTMEVGDLPPAEVLSGDLVLIPPDTPQRVTCDGPEDLIFCCVCQPPFEPGVYVDLEKGKREPSA
jgi:mannose-6-phosphate isomerase-like protein (cupin superfamily)